MFSFLCKYILSINLIIYLLYFNINFIIERTDSLLRKAHHKYSIIIQLKVAGLGSFLLKTRLICVHVNNLSLRGLSINQR